MAISGMNRRTVLQHAGAWALAGGVLSLAARGDGAWAQAVTAPDSTTHGFTPDVLRQTAEELAKRPFAKPAIELPEPFDKLTYDQYRDIRFPPEQAIWRGEKLDYELQLFPLGYLFEMPVEVWLVEGGQARLLKADGTLFSIGPNIPRSATGRTVRVLRLSRSWAAQPLRRDG